MAWLGFGAAMQRFLKGDRALRAFNVTMGVLLAATVVVLV
jgi:threonine/homoserine/homoserine lactone efflux protein